MVVRPVAEGVETRLSCFSAQCNEVAAHHTHVALHMAWPSFVAIVGVGQSVYAQFQFRELS